MAIILAGCSQEAEQPAETESFANPVYEPVLADPSIIQAEDGSYYAYGTEDAWGDDSETKLVPISRSTNLIDWEFVGEAFEEKPDWKTAGDLWAPDIQFYNDQYMLFYSLSLWGDSNPGIGVAVAASPAGPFEDKGKLFTSEEIGVDNSIDPFFYVEDEVPYLAWGSFHGIYGIELSQDGLTTVGEKFQLAGEDYEAPYIIERDGFYYFFGSKGSCCDGQDSTYHVAVGRSENFKGPYVDREGKTLLDNGGTTILSSDEESKFAGPGHNSVIKDEAGEDWLVYHAIEKADPVLWTGASRRPLMIDPIIWEDGWPAIEGGQPSEEEIPVPVMD
ncbi:arabinan endo-1,5-alpha-L-arabinosidase [Planomicrobium stackebrandtii]|uniref:Arabinan endo-1,5-alpha-L-arabinosidase n=1 Tax=Planomicrobium stackebrandtii TaxID=253160 RepID=A0ABU0GTD5_9BACL|nr:family 43 glycosylhydrolase [Planomicrobium stackebrandtii]MDQ0428612.1 arabinan endo-1,5-alpha-L-arabinosidase [Planomicrobium stackebrandtii]